MNDKRKFERIETHLLLYYKGFGDNVFNTSQLINISRGGIKFTTGRKYDENEIIIISLLAPTSYPNKITIRGITIYSNEKIKGSLYETAIKFDENSVEVQKELNKYLDFLGADKNKNQSIETFKKIDEKRRFKRLNSQVLMQFIDLETQTIKSSQIINISEEGLLFNCDTPLNEGKKIRLRMVIPTSYPDPIKIEGTVKHSEEIMKNTLYKIGIEFSKEYPEQLEKIKKYIQYLEKKENKS